MAKRRKTKRQKVSSDSRHLVETIRLEESQSNLSQISHTPQAYSLGTIAFSSKPQSQQIVSVSDYQYLRTDVKKISLVTALIILTELGIFWTTNGF